MAKVSTIRPDLEYVVNPADYRDTGSLTAFTIVDVTDIFGQTRSRRVSLGKCHSLPLETAREMVKTARDSNKTTNPVLASFTLSL